jgi:hypothetical protein
VIQDWISLLQSWNCQQLGLPIPHLLQFKDHAYTCDRFAIISDEYGDQLHSCTQHAGATTGAHEHILTAVQRLFNQAGYATERKNVPHSWGMKKADLHVKDFRFEGIRDVDVTLSGEFESSTAHALIPRATERHHTPIPTARSTQSSKRSLTTTNTITASATSSSFRPS